MGLRNRLIVVLALFTAMSLAVQLGVLRLAVLPGFEQADHADAERSLTRVRRSLDGELRQLQGSASDYAVWDDTYRFAAGEMPGYIGASFTAGSMVDHDLDAFAILDRNGALLYGAGRADGEPAPLPADIAAELPTLWHRLAAGGPEARVGGILVTPETLWLVSAQPILHTDGSGPPGGMLVMARRLGRVAARLAEQTQSPIELWRVGDEADGPPSEVAQAVLRRLLEGRSPFAVERGARGEVAIFGLLRDLAGQPALLLQVTVPGSDLALGGHALRVAALAFLASGVVLAVLLTALLQRLIARPLAEITTRILAMGRTGDLSRPLEPCRRGDELGALALAFDQLRASLHKAQQGLRETFDGVDDLFFALDHELRFTIVNRACLDAWRLPPGELVGRPFLEVPPQLAGSEAAQVAERVLASRRAERIETFSPLLNAPAELHVAPRQDGGLVAHLHDISKHKAAERAKSAFLATMSHEIRTPLTAILGFADLLARSPLSPEQAQHLKIVRDTGQTLLTVVNDILDLSKLEAGKMSLERIPVDLGTLLREALAASELLGAEKGLAFRLELDPALPALVAADPVRLKQVVGNLLSNALKFTSKGGITLRARVAGREGASVRLRVEVEDTGIGVAPEHKPRLFAMFEQADQTTTRRFGGTGLGLAICKRLVEAMGGGIGVESAPGAGSLFWFELSLGPAQAAPTAAPAAGPVAAGRALSVLVVDDVATNRLLLKALLQGLGHVPSLVEDGVQAVEAAGQSRYDLILMDLHMPRMDGLMATQAIRSGGGPNAATAIVALSADVLPETARAFREAGMVGHLAKPIDPQRLRELLGTLAAAPSPEAATA